ncbi:uncharacterized protein LOC126377609 isoform X2 [Pectinophora gossypiella]|uniref:uncharacterized protein LOC126377609 isoform X2 n=1 Tax=Pectinophora gossypiella TaxID=13191 RepID=UPI00214F40B5|nr:uncharacterized protein LOC126377609 isoform X2 [Pectinophora gossypiella]
MHEKLFLICALTTTVYASSLDIGATSGDLFSKVYETRVIKNSLYNVRRTQHVYYKLPFPGQKIKESVQLIYGTKSWRFPKQDVNLTLTYPVSKNSNTNYILTSMEVVLYCDGTQSSGYITEGGMNQDFISMTFTLPGVTQLSYQFWLYGIPKTCIHYNTTLNKNICGPSYLQFTYFLPTSK